MPCAFDHCQSVAGLKSEVVPSVLVVEGTVEPVRDPLDVRADPAHEILHCTDSNRLHDCLHDGKANKDVEKN